MQQIATAFVKAQKQFAPALKTSTNPHFKSKYADLASCVEAVIDALNENGIALVQRTHTAEDGVTVETLFVHESGETISGGLLHFPANKQDPQGYMGCLTYARRGSLMAACGIAPEDDDGNAATKSVPVPKGKTSKEQYIKLITESENEDELRENYTKAVQAMRGDRLAVVEIAAAKDKRKAELQSAGSRSNVSTDAVSTPDVLA